MTKQIHFVVYYDPSDDGFWLDDESLMAKFGDRAWFDDEKQEWVRPEDAEEEQLDQIISERLATLTQPIDTTTYFTTDGSYGVAKGITLVNTSNWDEADWALIEEASDSERPALARHISNVKVTCPQ
jgi:hypothetical protein